MLLTRAPVAGRGKQAFLSAAPRLACVKPVASVHPEPGSNSSLLFILSFFFFLSKKQKTKTCLSLLFCLHGTAASWQCGPLGLFSMTASSERSCHRLDSGFTRGRPCGRRLVNLLGIEQSRLLLQTCSCTTLCLYCKSFKDHFPLI